MKLAQITPRLRLTVCESNKMLSHMGLEPTTLGEEGSGVATAQPLGQRRVSNMCKAMTNDICFFIYLNKNEL